MTRPADAPADGTGQVEMDPMGLGQVDTAPTETSPVESSPGETNQDAPGDVGQPATPPAATDQETRHRTELRSSRHVTASVGGASDVGHRHEVNQDAYRVELVPAEGRTMSVLVIADGVSSAMNSDIASDQAVAAASRRIVGHLTEKPGNTPEELAEVMADAFALANMAVLGGTGEASGGGIGGGIGDDGMDAVTGSCTLIAGVTTPESIEVANVGDSRGYWVGDDGTCVRMSIDDSVAQARIDMGVPREEAETGVHSHAITRWIGPAATDVTPRVLSYTPDTSGWLLICSDGLWNYASDPTEIGALVQHATADSTAERGAQWLVDWALGQGGRDNVTVALARWEHS